ncbi:MAG: hypothetical protein ABWZ83_09405 [Mesorhizobium sp.]
MVWKNGGRDSLPASKRMVLRRPAPPVHPAGEQKKPAKPESQQAHMGGHGAPPEKEDHQGRKNPYENDGHGAADGCQRAGRRTSILPLAFAQQLPLAQPPFGDLPGLDVLGQGIVAEACFGVAKRCPQQFQIEVEIYLCRRDDRGARHEEIDDRHGYADQGQVGVVVRRQEVDVPYAKQRTTRENKRTEQSKPGRARIRSHRIYARDVSYGAFLGFLKNDNGIRPDRSGDLSEWLQHLTYHDFRHFPKQHYFILLLLFMLMHIRDLCAMLEVQ